MSNIIDLLDLGKEEILKLDKSDNHNITKLFIQQYLLGIRPLDYYLYKNDTDNKCLKISKNVSCIIENEQNSVEKSIGYYYSDYLEDIENENYYVENSEHIGFSTMNELDRNSINKINKFIEILGCLLYESNYYYEIESNISKVYGNLIIPLFFEGEYKIKKKDKMSNDHEIIRINSNCVKYEPSLMDENLKFNNYKVLNPFGFDNDCINYLCEYYYVTQENSNKYKNYCKKIPLELSNKCKNGLKKVSLKYPH